MSCAQLEEIIAMQTMRAMMLDRPRMPLVLRERPLPAPGAGQIVVEVKACGVCRTDLHVVDGDLSHPQLPIVPGHEIVGRVSALGDLFLAPTTRMTSTSLLNSRTAVWRFC